MIKFLIDMERDVSNLIIIPRVLLLLANRFFFSTWVLRRQIEVDAVHFWPELDNLIIQLRSIQLT